MYNESSVFYVLNRDYDVEFVIVGHTELIEQTLEHINNFLIVSSFVKHSVSWMDLDDYWWYVKKKMEYIIHDEHRHVVPTRNIVRDAKERGITIESINIKYNRWRHRLHDVNFVFRKGPVPYTSRGRKLRRRYLGHHRFFPVQRLRKELTHSPEFTRAKRKVDITFAQFPMWVDDFPVRSSYFDKRSWKKVKKRKQWM